MGYKIWCKGCGHNYFTLGGKSWYTSGTITRTPSYGNCCCCGANESNPGRSWRGNVAKIECSRCSNLITVITWSDWNNRSGEDAGYCDSCRSDFVNKKDSWNNLKSKASSCSWGSVGWDGWSSYSSLKSACFRIKCHSKSHSVYNGSNHSSISNYLSKSRCPECDRYDATKSKSNFCPDYYTFSQPNWARVNKNIDSSNWIWKTCEIYCIKNNHCVFYNVSMNDDQSKPAGYFHKEITAKLGLSDCDKCKAIEIENQRQAQAAASATDKINNLDKNIADINQVLNNINDVSDEAKSDETSPSSTSKDKLAQIEKNEQAVTDMIHEFQKFKDDAQSNRTKNADIITDISSNNTFPTQEDLDDALNKLNGVLTKSAEEKKKLNKQIQDAVEKELATINEEKKNNEQLAATIKEEQKLNDINTQISAAKLKLATFTGSELKAKGDGINQLKQAFDDLVGKIKEKCGDNQKRKKELEECQKRLRDIKGKLKREKSDCKYLLDLIKKECERVQTATDEVMEKFEERTTYFLSVTVGLPQECVEKLVDYELEDILELEEADLVEEGLSTGHRKRLMRRIKEFKAKSNE